MVRSREVESRTCRLKVGYSTSWVMSTCRASAVPCLWEHGFVESHFRCAWKRALAENGRVEQRLSGSKPDALPFGEFSKYTLCITAYTLISLTEFYLGGIRVTWFWFSATKKAPIRRCASDRCSYRAEYGKQPILGWFYITITALWFAQTDNTKQPKRFQLLHNFCNLFCLFIIAANIGKRSFHQIQCFYYTICRSQSQGFSQK